VKRNQQAVLLRQLVQESPRVAVTSPKIVQHRPPAVQQDFRIQDLERETETGCQAMGVFAKALAAPVHARSQLEIAGRSFA
jgi:hypothetical protein